MRPTFAVVRLHSGNAFAAAAIASWVSSSPISGTLPSSSLVAGSTQFCEHRTKVESQSRGLEEVRTGNSNLFTAFRINPLPIDIALELDQTRISKTKLHVQSLAGSDTWLKPGAANHFSLRAGHSDHERRESGRFERRDSIPGLLRGQGKTNER
jgi:hypothetical protein